MAMNLIIVARLGSEFNQGFKIVTVGPSGWHKSLES